MKSAILLCMLIGVTMMSGCINHKNLILENEWDSLKVGCLVFNGTTYEKRIITIDDHKFLSNLKKKFKPSYWWLSPWIGCWGVQPYQNRLRLSLRENQTVEMYYYNYLSDVNLGVEFQDLWTFRAKISPVFINYLLQYLEKKTQSKTKFHLSCSEWKKYSPPLGWSYRFYDIDFGHGRFCILFGDIKKFKKIPAIRDNFAFEPIMNNSYPYLDRFLSKYKPYTQKLNYTNGFKIYCKKQLDPFAYNLYYKEKRERGQKSRFKLLIKEIIHNKATFIIFSGEKTKIFEKTPPLTICYSEKELFNILKHQYMTKGAPYLILCPKISCEK